MAYTCLIVDDEPLAQQVLSTYLKQMPQWELKGVCRHAMEALEVLQNEQVDLMFLDIQMPVISGLEFLKSLPKPPNVIFTTAFPNYALEGFELDAVDYLLKPISFERFLKAINKVTAKLTASQTTTAATPATNAPDYFFVKEDSKQIKVKYADIYFLEGMKDYVKIYTPARVIVTHITMKRLEEILPSDKFMRIHKSYIIALEAIHTVFGNMVEIDKYQLPVGSIYKDELLKIIDAKN
ncbi:MAG: response regulator transcription factor [Filimonas sp.]|nr:response regulator transcription factor [Filimonas sp.]